MGDQTVYSVMVLFRAGAEDSKSMKGTGIYLYSMSQVLEAENSV